MSKEHVYYCKVKRPSEETLPAKGLKRFVPYRERQYTQSVDCMTCGYAVYDRVLDPWEIVRYGLISAPVD